MLQRYREVLIIAALMFIGKSGYALQRGVPVKEGVAPAVVKLIVADGIKMPNNCTGSFISRKHILTAAHCFQDVSQGMFSEPGISDLKTYCKSCFKPFNHVRIHPEYRGFGDISHDLAIIVLEANISIPENAWLSIGEKTNDRFFAKIFAFGSSKTDLVGSWVKRFGEVHAQKTQDGMMASMGDMNPYRRYKGAPESTFVPVSISVENSGAPLIDQKTNQIVGVVSHMGCFDLERLKPSSQLRADPTHECPYVYQTQANYYADLTRSENQTFIKNILLDQ